MFPVTNEFYLRITNKHASADRHFVCEYMILKDDGGKIGDVVSQIADPYGTSHIPPEGEIWVIYGLSNPGQTLWHIDGSANWSTRIPLALGEEPVRIANDVYFSFDHSGPAFVGVKLKEA